jgi:hypothetical protein
MPFGADKRFVTLFAAALLTWFSSACGQSQPPQMSKEKRMKLVEQYEEAARQMRFRKDFAGAL